MNIDFILDRETEYCEMMIKRFKDPLIITNLKVLRKKYVDKLVEHEQLSKHHNNLSKLISIIKKNEHVTTESAVILDELFNNSDVEFDYNDRDLTAAMVKNKAKEIQEHKTKLEKLVDQHLENIKKQINEIPNLLDLSVPISISENDNTVIYQTDICEKKKYGQYELCLKTGIYESAAKISGNRGYFLVDDGVRLNTALLAYAQDFIRNRGYKVMQTPFLITRDSMKTVCQLSDFDETLYKIENEEQYLIATSEQPLTAYFKGKNISESELPVKLSGVSSCFRKETGKHGKDTNGIFRVHQFEKIEQFCVTNAEESYKMMDEMLSNAKDFYESLEIQYRVVSIVSGALNNAASKKYDIEGWFCGSGEFRELVSCSNTTDYFSRKLNCKNNHNELLHMLNSTLYANTRTICCLLEMGQTELGIQIPDVLVPYFGKKIISYLKI